jgi:hypothetical protein
MLERRIRDVKIVPRKERSVNGVATTASMITPDN